jgi:hypothetical protein
VLIGQYTTLTWSATGADSCTASGGWQGSQTTAGSSSVGPILQASTLFSLTCVAVNGNSATQSVIVMASATGDRFSFEQSWDAVRDVVWDPVRNVFYLAIGSNGFLNPNSITVFDPEAGTVNASVQAGSEPSALGISDDGKYLYVGFGGSDSIERYLLPALTLDTSFPVSASIRSGHGDPVFPSQIVVAPGDSQTIAVATQNPRSLPSEGLFEVFDNATPRTIAVAPSNFSATSLAWAADGSTVFGGEYSGAIDKYQSTPSITLQGTATPPAPQGMNPFSIQGAITYSAGSLFNSNGDAFDATTLKPNGTFATKGLVTVDAANDTVFVASWGGAVGSLTVAAYDLGSYSPRETISVTKYDPSTLTNITPSLPARMVRWGVDGLAIVDVNGRLDVIWGPFVAAGAGDSPVGAIPGANPCCSQNPLEVMVTQTLSPVVANDILWDSTDGILLASIPDSDSAHPGSIAVIDPVTGQASKFVQTMANPGALAMSDDGQCLYVGEAGGFQRFLLPSLTPDIVASFNFLQGLSSGEPPTQMIVQPGAPGNVSAVFAVPPSPWFFIFNDATQVTVTSTPATSWLQWSVDGQTLYGLDSLVEGGPPLWQSPPGDLTNSQSLGDPFTYPFPANQGAIYPIGMRFTNASGLLYGDTGAIFDPQSGGWPGTLPLSMVVGSTDALGTFAFDTIHHRAYADVCADFDDGYPCSNYLVVYDLDSYTAIATTALQGFTGQALRLQLVGGGSLAILGANNQLMFVNDPSVIP